MYREVAKDPGTELKVDPVSGSIVMYGRPWSLSSGNTASGENALLRLHQGELACNTAFDFLLLGCLVRSLLPRAMGGTVLWPRATSRGSATLWLWQLPQRQQLEKACWMGLLFIVASGVFLRSRVKRRYRKNRSRGKKNDVFMENAAFTTDNESTVDASPSDDDRSCTEISHEDLNDCNEQEVAIIYLRLPMMTQPFSVVPIKQWPRITNLLLEEVDSTVSNAEVFNLDLGPSESDVASGCNQQPLKKETWLGNALVSFDTDNVSYSDSDIDDSDSDITDTSSEEPFTRRWTEPAGTPSCSGFVRQRTEELNSSDSVPLFPLRIGL